MKKKTTFSLVNNTKHKIPKRYFLFVLEKFLEKMKVKNPIELSLILTSEKEIQKLNKKYRKKDTSTDVLSFPIDIIKKEDIKKFKKDDKIILGDIYLCPEFIKKNVGAIHESPKKLMEGLRFTFLHGLIHLIGYNHKNKKGKEKWQKIIKKITN